MFCSNLIFVQEQRRFRTLNRGIRFSNNIRWAQKVLLPTNLLQNKSSSVKWCDHRDKIKTISQINHRYLVSTTHILTTFQIFKWLFIPGCGSYWCIILLLRFKKRNNFILSRMLIVKGWDFCPRWSSFKLWFSCNKPLQIKSGDQLAQNWFILNNFNRFGA